MLLPVDDLRFADEQPPIALERHEKGVGAVADVLDESRRQSQQRAIVVDGVIEAAAAVEVAAGKHEVADRTVGELEVAA